MRFSSSQEVIVHPSITDGDCKEETKMMGHVKKVMQINTGDRTELIETDLYFKNKAAPREFGNRGI